MPKELRHKIGQFVGKVVLFATFVSTEHHAPAVRGGTGGGTPPYRLGPKHQGAGRRVGARTHPARIDQKRE